MEKVTIELDSSIMKELKELSANSGISVENLIKAHIHELLSEDESEFLEIAKKVLAKNKELYHRLA